MPNIINLTDKNGNIIYPRTTIDAVTISDSSVASVLNTVPIVMDEASYKALVTKEKDRLYIIKDKNNLFMNDILLNERNVTLESFSITPMIAEIGSTVNSVTVSYSCNGMPEVQKINGKNINLSSSNIYSNEQGTYILNKTFSGQTEDGGNYLLPNISNQITYEITMNSGRKISKTLELKFFNRIFWGVTEAPENGKYDSAFILELANPDSETVIAGGSELTGFRSGEYFLDTDKMVVSTIDGIDHVLIDNIGRSIVVDCSENKYIYYCLPTRYINEQGEPYFFINSILGGMDSLGTINFTNASGYTEEYDIYRSSNHSLGMCHLEVR